MAREFVYHPLGTYQAFKQPSEVITLRADFSKELDSGDTIDVNASTATATDANGTDVSSSMIVSGSLKTDSSNKKLEVQVKGGTDKEQYKITLLAVTTNSNKYEVDVKLFVNEV